MRVRPAEEGDVPSILRLFIEGHEFHARGVPDRFRVPESFDEEEISSDARSTINGDSSSILLPEEGGQILGLAEIHIKHGESRSAVVGRRNGYLESIVVSEGHRRRGWGRVLVDEAQRWAQQRGADRCAWTSGSSTRIPFASMRGAAIGCCDAR